jgi:hypothetical protein
MYKWLNLSLTGKRLCLQDLCPCINTKRPAGLVINCLPNSGLAKYRGSYGQSGRAEECLPFWFV